MKVLTEVNMVYEPKVTSVKNGTFIIGVNRLFTTTIVTQLWDYVQVNN